MMRPLSSISAPPPPNELEQQQQLQQRPKLHWSEEFRIRSPKVPPGRLRSEPVVAIDIESDAFADRRTAFVLRRTSLGGPLQPRLRGVGKILSWCGLASLPYLFFCKWAGGSPLLGDMTSFAVPASVAGLSVGYLLGNLAVEKAIFARRIYSIGLDETDPELVYVTMLPVGGWLHGSYHSYITRMDNLEVEMPTRGNWGRLRFKTGWGDASGSGGSEWLTLPASKSKLYVVDARAMAAFVDRCCGRPSSGSGSGGGGGDGGGTDSSSTSSNSTKSDYKRFERIVVPTDGEIDRHLDAALRDGGVGGGVEETQQPPPLQDEQKKRQHQQQQQ